MTDLPARLRQRAEELWMASADPPLLREAAGRIERLQREVFDREGVNDAWALEVDQLRHKLDEAKRLLVDENNEKLTVQAQRDEALEKLEIYSKSIDTWKELHCKAAQERDEEKERRIHWQGLAYKEMNLVDCILGKSVTKGEGTTEDEFADDCKAATESLKEESDG